MIAELCNHVEATTLFQVAWTAWVFLAVIHVLKPR